MAQFANPRVSKQTFLPKVCWRYPTNFYTPVLYNQARNSAAYSVELAFNINLWNNYFYLVGVNVDAKLGKRRS